MEKILIVDDSPFQGIQLKDILKDEYDVAVALTAKEGFDRAVVEDFSLILLDVVMPGMDGFTLLKKLQEESSTRSVPVIMITSLSDIEHEQLGFKLGAVDYIRTDQLTGIANRRQYDYDSIKKWKEAIRLQVPFTICMFDIDRFKAYNDTYGHPAGDKVIVSIAKTVSSYFHRSTDFFARYGGEEFVAILLGDDSQRSYEYLEEIRQAIEDLHIPHAPSAGKWVTVSIGGVTVIPQSESVYDSYLEIADTMLYDAKRFGRNRVVWADENVKHQWDNNDSNLNNVEKQ